MRSRSPAVIALHGCASTPAGRSTSTFVRRHARASSCRQPRARLAPRRRDRRPAGSSIAHLPEQTRGRRARSARSSLWVFAAVLFGEAVRVRRAKLLEAASSAPPGRSARAPRRRAARSPRSGCGSRATCTTSSGTRSPRSRSRPASPSTCSTSVPTQARAARRGDPPRRQGSRWPSCRACSGRCARATTRRACRRPDLDGAAARSSRSLRAAGLAVELDTSTATARRCPSWSPSPAIRIAQEALTNVARHAGPGARARRAARRRAGASWSSRSPTTAPARRPATHDGQRADRDARARRRASAGGSRPARCPAAATAVRAIAARADDPRRARRRPGADPRRAARAARRRGRLRGRRARPPTASEAVALVAATAARRRADGHPHAGARRPRGDAPDRRRPRARGRARRRAHDVRARRVRVRRAARRGERLPAQGRGPGRAPARACASRRPATRCSRRA